MLAKELKAFGVSLQKVRSTLDMRVIRTIVKVAFPLRKDDARGLGVWVSVLSGR